MRLPKHKMMIAFYIYIDKVYQQVAKQNMRL